MSLGAEEASFADAGNPASLGVRWLDVSKLFGSFVAGAPGTSFDAANASARSPRQRRQMPLPSTVLVRGNPQRGQRSLTGSAMMVRFQRRVVPALRIQPDRFQFFTRLWI